VIVIGNSIRKADQKYDHGECAREMISSFPNCGMHPFVAEKRCRGFSWMEAFRSIPPHSHPLAGLVNQTGGSNPHIVGPDQTPLALQKAEDPRILPIHVQRPVQ
jgi:hypothetical protein